jgi:hypothetical protein
MKNLVLVLLDMEHSIEFMGAFPHEGAAVEWIWSQRVNKTFTAWPVGADKKADECLDLLFQENTAVLQLRPYRDTKGHHGSTSQISFAGLGPSSLRRVWIEQEGYEGDDAFLVAIFTAADGVGKTPDAIGALRRGSKDGVATIIYAHISSPAGQILEEKLEVHLAGGVQKTMLAPRATLLDTETLQYAGEDAGVTSRMMGLWGASQASQEEEELDDFICEGCLVSAVPGAIFPIASNGMTDHPYVEVCDVCRIFQLDVQAAKAVSVVFDRPLKLSEDGRPYLEGLTFEEAEQLAKSKQRPVPACWERKIA